MNFINYIPVLTTCFSIFFFYQIWLHYRSKPQAVYLLWWSAGVLTFGVGTFTESFHAIFGWNSVNTRFWYVSGALLGGFPLAQGTVYLLLKKRTADKLSLFFGLLILAGSIFIFLSPVYSANTETQKLTGKVFTWAWVRAFSPLVNLYSLVFLVGGAFYSARLYKKSKGNDRRWLGNIYIAIGALLPGIGGSFTRFGYVEVLFVTELVGLCMIYAGYRLMRGDKSVSIHENQTASAI